MEPVTYMVTYSLVVGSYAYFLVTKTEYTFLGSRAILSKTYREKLMREQNFNENRFNQLSDWFEQREDSKGSRRVEHGFDAKEVQRVFEEFDKDNSGSLTFNEFRKIAQEMSEKGSSSITWKDVKKHR